MYYQNKYYAVAQVSEPMLKKRLQGNRGGILLQKMSIVSKEARETKYWIRLLEKSEFVKYDYEMLLREVDDLINILTAIVKTSQQHGIKSENDNSKFKI